MKKKNKGKSVAKIRKIKSRVKIISENEVEKLCTFGRERYKEMSIEDKFEHELRNAVISVAYELALRSAEVRNIAWEDFEDAADIGDGLISVKVRQGMERMTYESSIVPVKYSRLKPTLDLWKKISGEYCKKYGIRPPEYEKNGEKYHPIFFDKKGKILTSSSYSNIVKKQAKLAGITGVFGHMLRRARIIHLAKRIPQKLLMIFARNLRMRREGNYWRMGSIRISDSVVDWFKKFDCPKGGKKG
ncbi:MAG: tyrosine-type recombinase/integrase [Elusimicrobia bacterium]|nr:tyrosine-type recombinase/integrase [Elusimicrobiota bacterium]